MVKRHATLTAVSPMSHDPSQQSSSITLDVQAWNLEITPSGPSATSRLRGQNYDGSLQRASPTEIKGPYRRLPSPTAPTIQNSPRITRPQQADLSPLQESFNPFSQESGQNDSELSFLTITAESTGSHPLARRIRGLSSR